MKVQLVYQSKVNIFRCNNVHVYINVQSKKVSISRKNSLFHLRDQLLKHNKKTTLNKRGQQTLAP